jgi:coatomer protein complex subunit epsilon
MANGGIVEAVALIVQIHLEQNRLDLAIKEVQAARSWAQDSLLVNLAESWVGLRVVRSPLYKVFGGYANVLQGGEKYQQAFYVFEELAQAPSTSSTQSLVSQAIAEIHLGRLEEAEAALQQALTKDPKNADSLANSIVLNVIAGKDVNELTRYGL